jgi:hypothetical protein
MHPEFSLAKSRLEIGDIQGAWALSLPIINASKNKTINLQEDDKTFIEDLLLADSEKYGTAK